MQRPLLDDALVAPSASAHARVAKTAFTLCAGLACVAFILNPEWSMKSESPSMSALSLSTVNLVHQGNPATISIALAFGIGFTALMVLADGLRRDDVGMKSWLPCCLLGAGGLCLSLIACKKTFVPSTESFSVPPGEKLSEEVQSCHCVVFMDSVILMPVLYSLISVVVMFSANFVITIVKAWHNGGFNMTSELKVGDIIEVTNDAEALERSFDGAAVVWGEVMRIMLGRHFKVLEVYADDGLLALPSPDVSIDHPKGSQGGMWYFPQKAVVKKQLNAGFLLYFSLKTPSSIFILPSFLFHVYHFFHTVPLVWSDGGFSAFVKLYVIWTNSGMQTFIVTALYGALLTESIWGWPTLYPNWDSAGFRKTCAGVLFALQMPALLLLIVPGMLLWPWLAIPVEVLSGLLVVVYAPEALLDLEMISSGMARKIRQHYKKIRPKTVEIEVSSWNELISTLDKNMENGWQDYVSAQADSDLWEVAQDGPWTVRDAKGTCYQVEDFSLQELISFPGKLEIQLVPKGQGGLTSIGRTWEEGATPQWVILLWHGCLLNVLCLVPLALPVSKLCKKLGIDYKVGRISFGFKSFIVSLFVLIKVLQWQFFLMFAAEFFVMDVSYMAAVPLAYTGRHWKCNSCLIERNMLHASGAVGEFWLQLTSLF